MNVKVDPKTHTPIAELTVNERKHLDKATEVIAALASLNLYSSTACLAAVKQLTEELDAQKKSE